MVSTKQTLSRDLSILMFYSCSSIILKLLSLLHKAWDILGIPRILIWYEKKTSRTHLLYSSLFCQQTWPTAILHIWAPCLENQVLKTKTFLSPYFFLQTHIFQSYIKSLNKQRSTFPTEVNHCRLPCLFLFFKKNFISWVETVCVHLPWPMKRS